MSEKKGYTNKSIYDFDTSAVLEVFLNNKWYRVTCEDFRSFDGSRRITKNGECINYDGDLYFYRTNKKVTPHNSNTIIYIIPQTESDVKLKNRDIKFRR